MECRIYAFIIFHDDYVCLPSPHIDRDNNKGLGMAVVTRMGTPPLHTGWEVQVTVTGL